MSSSEILQKKKFKCAFCKGSGIQPHSLHSHCRACRGKGKVEFEGPVIQCPSCQGRGTASGSSTFSCIRCGGKGIIEIINKDVKTKEAADIIGKELSEITKLGKYLKQLREEQKLSIRSVAKSCGLAPSYLAKIEASNTFKTIGVATLVKFSKFYGIPVSAMLKESGFVESYESDLPELAQYLRAKYQLSPQAIRDMTMAKEIVDKKYEREDA